MKLKDKVSLITGSGSGMGRATAILFANEGAKVIVSDINVETGNETVALIKKQGHEAFFVQTDVSKTVDVERLFKFTTDRFERLDILYNNAGVAMVHTPIEQVSEELWDRVLSVNVRSIFLAAKIVLPLMKKQGRGVIINTSSIGAVRPRPGLSAYAVSKAAVTTLTKIMALEAAPFGIRVNCISPVAADTNMLHCFLNEEEKKNLDAIQQGILETIPLGRWAKAEDIANMALFLASDDASLITGADFYVDGGRSIY